MRPMLIIFAFIALVVVLALSFPDYLLNPGRVIQGHAPIEQKCLACHKPFKGARAIQCTSCHKPDDISIKSVKGVALPKKAGNVLFHRGLPANSCLECHSDHKGRNAKKALRTFRHQSLDSGLRASCITCHETQKPQDNLHRATNRSCNVCHSTKAWKPAIFDHKSLSAQQRCFDCHKRDLPANRIHSSTSTNCATCHSTKAWKPATFNHKSLSAQQRCFDCHKRDLPANRIHSGIDSNCATCHSTRAWKPATFDHKSLSAQQRCFDCHKRELPANRIHADAASNCATCHSTRAWKPATFDHKSLSAQQRCFDCHKRDLPANRIHSGIDSNCATCHSTRAWKPATFDHNRYFLLDRKHRASCATCHNDPSDFRQYSCYGCHEHTPSNIAREHIKEGISNYLNCVKCHKNGSAED
ncbi:MAG: hypothetical protein HGA97_08195 [Chlorobiaceae bacterium]|nr:hypothetical protein [Chlorobiaceae bacterium]